MKGKRLALAAAAAAFMLVRAAAAQAPDMLHHIHGLAFSADGREIVAPSHFGLAVYADGRWSKAAGALHDYMGFAATHGGIYASGHPAPGSGLVNPLGLVRSTDHGRTWAKIGLEGQADFHLLAASFRTEALYALAEQPNDQMKAPGIYVSLNQGFTWQKAAASGLDGEIVALAVHPDDAKSVAIGTTRGLFLSRDAGATFRAIASGLVASGVAFDLDGKSLWYGGQQRATPPLARIDLAANRITAVTAPIASDDAVTYIAQNPAQRAQYAIATAKRDVFVTRDGGATWTQIAKRGSPV